MAIRKPAKRTKKAVRKGAGAKRAAARAPTRKQAARGALQKKVDAKLRDVMKLARALDAQGVQPDEIAARVKSDLAGLGADLVDGVLRLAGGSIHVNMDGEA